MHGHRNVYFFIYSRCATAQVITTDCEALIKLLYLYCAQKLTFYKGKICFAPRAKDSVISKIAEPVISEL